MNRKFSTLFLWTRTLHLIVDVLWRSTVLTGVDCDGSTDDLSSGSSVLTVSIRKEVKKGIHFLKLILRYLNLKYVSNLNSVVPIFQYYNFSHIVKPLHINGYVWNKLSLSSIGLLWFFLTHHTLCTRLVLLTYSMWISTKNLLHARLSHTYILHVYVFCTQGLICCS